MSHETTYECPHCRAQVAVADALLGKVTDCPECGRQFQVPTPVAKSVDPNRRNADPAAPSIERETDVERVLRKVHPVVFRNHLFLTVLGLLILLTGIASMGLGLAGNSLIGVAGTPLIVLGGALAAAAGVYFLYRLLQAISTTLQVTTERTIALRGILSRSSNEVQHDDVRNIQCNRNVLERLLNYGDIALSSSGQDDMEIVLHDVPDPEGIVRIIRVHQ